VVLVGKERLQLRGQLRVAGQQLLAVGRLTGIDRLEIGGHHLLKALLVRDRVRR
jgi:hypothetical protein